MPPGSLSYDFEDDKWQYLEAVIGKEIDTPQFFAVPITGQEAKQEPRKTLRDEFAMAALSGLNLQLLAEAAFKLDKGPETFKIAAISAYQFADAMLAARNQTA